MLKYNRLSDKDEDGWLMKEWERIKLPERATSGSAGYDFFLPSGYAIGDSWITIPTGIRCNIDAGWFMMCCPKSGLGFKYRAKLANTIGIIDSDYYYSNNEGHIMAKLSSEEIVCFADGDKFIQGIFLPFGITKNDNVFQKRNGGFGSTGN